MVMKDAVSNFVSFIEKAVILVILASTITAIIFEILKMIDAQYVELADLLLLFIYVEVIGMVRVYMISNRVRMTYPLFIAITALSRLIILQGKDSNPELLLYEAGAIVLVAIAVIILRLRYVPILRPVEGIDEIPSAPKDQKKK
jgi:protein PsiE